MKNFFVIYIAVFIVMAMGACKKSTPGNIEYKPGTVEKTSKDFSIPRQLREQIEKSYIEYIRKNNPKVVLSDEEILSRIPRDFLDVKMQFRSSAPRVLTDHTEFHLPRGGGEIDLAKYVIGEKGSFYLTMEAHRSESPEAELDNLTIYFLSNAKQRKIQNEVYGIGCKSYLEVTQVIEKANKDNGLQLNATQQRYVPVVGGVFYFVNFNSERKIYIASVRVTDSRYPDLFCDEKI